jgi:integrase
LIFVNTAFNDIIKGMLTEAITIDHAKAYLESVVQTHLARIDAARWREAPPANSREWRNRWMQDRADAYALRLLSSRGPNAELLSEDMDHLRAQGFQPQDMALVAAALFKFSEQYWVNNEYPDPREALKTDQITPEDHARLRSTALQGAAIALEQRDRRALESAPMSSTPSFQQQASQTTPQKPGPAPTAGRFSAAMLDVVDRLDEEEKSALTKNGKNPKSQKDTARQRRRVILQFCEFTGKRDITELKNEDLSYYVDCLTRLPKIYNKSAKDRQIPLEQLMERSDDLPPEEVGLSGTTINRNLSFISAILRKARKDGIRPFEPLELDLYRQKPTTAARAQRPAFTSEDIASIFKHPTFHGRQSAARPHNPGNELVKDALYWAPFIAALSGARREEICGMRLNELHLDAHIPHFEITPNENRGLKTPQSRRLVPVHSSLLQHGLSDYCNGLRSSGETDLFPDLRPTSEGVSFGDNLHYRWRELLKRQIGSDTGGKVFHSFRHYVITVLSNEKGIDSVIVKDLVGHLNGDITLDRYRDTSLLCKLRDAVEMLPRVF